MGGSPSVADVAVVEHVDGRTSTGRPAWLLFLSIAIPTLTGVGLIVLSLDATLPPSYGFPGFTALFTAAYGAVGSVVVARRPQNRVGYVLLGVGAIAGALTFAIGYAYAGLIAAPGSLPLADVAAWLMAWLWLPLVFLAGPILLSIFPDGRFLSARWRVVGWVAGISTAVAMVLLALRRGPLENFPTLDNPFGVVPFDVTEVLRPPVFLPMTAAIIGAAISLVVRYRGSDRDRQHQLKWIAVSALAFAILSPLGFIAGKLGQVIFILAMCGIPLAAGIAVLRYRLYDIDTIINRTIVYGLLTAVLAGLYTASVGLMQRVSQAFSGASSEVAIVLTTIVIVSAFTPIKNRLQRLVDLRFKENVDPEQRLEAFVGEVRRRISPLDERLVARRFLDVAMEACQSSGGRLDLDVGDEPTWSVVVGELAGTGEEVVAASRGGLRIGVTLARPKGARSIPTRDLAAVRDALDGLLEELG